LKRNIKLATAISIVLLATIFTVGALNISYAQTLDQAVVVITSSIGGTTDPAPGTYNYDNGTNIVITATPSEGYAFHYWVISGSYTPGHSPTDFGYITDPETGEIIAQIPRPDTTGINSLVYDGNPLNVTCGYGYTFTYQAVFTSTAGSNATNETATVVIQPSTGGTTTPAAGTYNYPNGTTITLQATPNTGYEFSYWVVSGNFTPGHEPTQITTIVDENGTIIGEFPVPSTTGINSLTFTANPANITCGYGYTFTYQAVFTPTTAGSPSPSISPSPSPTSQATPTPVSPTPTVTESPSPTPSTGGGIDYTTWIIIVVIVIIIIVVAVAAIAMRRRR
jgi:hypothetical protein